LIIRVPYFLRIFLILSSPLLTPSMVAAKTSSCATSMRTLWSISPFGGSSSAQMLTTLAKIMAYVAKADFIVQAVGCSTA